MAVITFRSVNKNPDTFKAVSDFDLETEDGEFVVLVGSPGCGKTTTMRMIAGLEVANSGDMLGDGIVVMRGGLAQQTDTPQIICGAPVNCFVSGIRPEHLVPFDDTGHGAGHVTGTVEIVELMGSQVTILVMAKGNSAAEQGEAA